MRWHERRTAFRALLAEDDCFHPTSVWDPLSVRMAEETGYEVAMLAGSVASLAVLGAPDLILLTLSEFADQAHRINRAGRLPLLVDADHGYGNALNVRRTVEELETAGVAALTIEDTDLPRPFGETSHPRLLPLEEGVGKMRAALDAHCDPSLVIAGRTSAAAIANLDEALRRARAYQDAGVDAVFLTGISEEEPIRALGAELDVPIFLGGAGTGCLGDRPFLASCGVRISLQGHAPIAAAVEATGKAFRELQGGRSPDSVSATASGAVMDRLTREADYRDWTQTYLQK